MALYGILFGRYCSCIGYDALFFTQRYNCTVQDIIDGRVNSIVRYHCNTVFDDYCLNVANCLYELIMVIDNMIDTYLEMLCYLQNSIIINIF